MARGNEGVEEYMFLNGWTGKSIINRQSSDRVKTTNNTVFFLQVKYFGALRLLMSFIRFTNKTTKRNHSIN